MRPLFVRCCAAGAGLLLLGTSGLNGEDLADLVEKVEPAVVQVNCDRSLGSGVVVDAAGIIATNYHVIEGTREANAKFRDGTSARVAGYLAIDPGRDLAILKLEGAGGKLTSLPLAEKLPRKGDKVAAFGAPLGLSFSASEGIVSAIRSGEEMNSLAEGFAQTGHNADATWVQTTASISHGNSGGPLINMRGQVVGLNTLILAAGNSLNFAVSVNDLRGLLQTAGTTVHRFSTLPKVKRHATVMTNSDDFKIKLPSGRILNSVLLKIDPQLMALAIRQSHKASQSKYPSGAPRNVVYCESGVLNGLAMMLYETQELKLYAMYQDGKRHGPISMWNEEGRRLYWGQYDKGKRDGLCCVFQSDGLWMVLEYKHDTLEAIHLMSGLSIEKSFKKRDDAKADEKAKPLLEALAEVELQLKKNETELKKQVAADDLKARKAKGRSGR